MALFFDVDWFEARLAERGLTRRSLAGACGLAPADLDLAFKDQRELGAREVAILAEMLGASVSEIADRAGVATPGRLGASLEERLEQLERRVATLEARLAGGGG